MFLKIIKQTLNTGKQTVKAMLNIVLQGAKQQKMAILLS
jgi:hypothetical protein